MNQKEVCEETREMIADVVGKPRFTHDCDECVFLGNYAGHDLYFCPRDDVDGYTVIARWSSLGSDYTSGAVFGKTPLQHGGRILRVAHLIASDFGLIGPKAIINTNGIEKLELYGGDTKEESKP